MVSYGAHEMVPTATLVLSQVSALATGMVVQFLMTCVLS